MKEDELYLAVGGWGQQLVASLFDVGLELVRVGAFAAAVVRDQDLAAWLQPFLPHRHTCTASCAGRYLHYPQRSQSMFPVSAAIQRHWMNSFSIFNAISFSSFIFQQKHILSKSKCFFLCIFMASQRDKMKCQFLVMVLGCANRRSIFVCAHTI